MPTDEAVVIFLAEQRPAYPGKDPLGRANIGYSPGMSERDCWQRNRGVWHLNDRRAMAADHVVIVSPDGVIRVVGHITGLTKVTAADTDITKYVGRRIIEGAPCLDHQLVGANLPVPRGSRNPVAYFPASALGL